ncbi:MAG: hypothetical protein DLM61_11660 [Pseudonocardiales bacterium]|nr:MAG: hypothetical protein DLM61_11660 [Pseudonocardiales bacterium]
MTDHIETVGDLIAALDGYDRDTRIRLAIQPRWPFEYTISGVAQTPDTAEGVGIQPTGEPVVWIAQGGQVDYLPPIASNALGWSQ